MQNFSTQGAHFPPNAQPSRKKALPYPARATAIFNNWYKIEDCPFFLPSSFLHQSTVNPTTGFSGKLSTVCCLLSTLPSFFFHLPSSFGLMTNDFFLLHLLQLEESNLR